MGGNEKNMNKDEVIKAFGKGTPVRLTGGIWNTPAISGKFVHSVAEIETFYDCYYCVNAEIKNRIIEVRGSTHCDMF